jgi:uncharacterized protein (UPF0276 family)
MTGPGLTFAERAAAIPFHGIGLSVDLYTPDLFELMEALSGRGLTVDYLEIFKARGSDLLAAAKRLPKGTALEYHADGLWYCQPEFFEAYPWHDEVETLREHTRILGSRWATHECATKQMVGYSFGTYLPPILSEESARTAGRNAQAVQEHLGPGPLLLVEVPPFYYFVPGDMDLADYFSVLSEECDCGLLFDVGHLYTYYLYSGVAKTVSPDRFLSGILDRFPLERVIQIHLAGLKPLTGGSRLPNAPIDNHGAVTPNLLFRWTETVLASPRLIHLKGVAMEVDTKPIRTILDEYERFTTLCRGKITRLQTVGE